MSGEHPPFVEAKSKKQKIDLDSWKKIYRIKFVNRALTQSAGGETGRSGGKGGGGEVRRDETDEAPCCSCHTGILNQQLN